MVSYGAGLFISFAIGWSIGKKLVSQVSDYAFNLLNWKGSVMSSQAKKKRMNVLSGWGFVVLMIFLGGGLIAGCGGPEGPAEISQDDSGSGSDTEFKVTQVKYAIMNLAEGYDSVCDSGQDVTNCYWLQLQYEGEDPDADRLKVTFSFVEHPEYNWIVDGFEDITEEMASLDQNLVIDTDEKKILVRGLHALNTVNPLSTQSNQRVLPLGDLTVTAESNGKTTEYPNIETLMGPEELDFVDSPFIYADPQTNSDSEIMIQPALVNIDNSYRYQDKVRIDFAVSDENDSNGQIWFFNQAGSLVAVSDSLEISEVQNTVDFGLENIHPVGSDDSEDVFDDITHFSVLITRYGQSDEKMFIGESGCVSFTAKYSLAYRR